MSSVLPLKRLFRVAVSTSTAIGVITLAPVYVFVIILGNMNINASTLGLLLFTSVMGVSFFVFAIWMVNIGLLKFFNKRTLLHQIKNIRYIASYLVCLSLMFSIRLFTNPIVSDEERVQEILSWKIQYFGIQPDAFDYMRFTDLPFQLMIMLFVVLSIDTVVLIIQEMVLLIERKTSVESENMQLKIKNIEAANEKLKQQLQPHFLFNALNILKTLIKKQPDNAETYLKRLSDFLRASVMYDDVDLVKFEEELKLGIDYIEMQKIRFKDAIHFQVDIPEDAKKGMLPLFSIQLLLENAIKHNAFTIESPLNIRLSCKDSLVMVKNNIRLKKAEGATTGKGLANLAERYKILSGDEVLITSEPSEFSVSIKVLSDSIGDRISRRK